MNKKLMTPATKLRLLDSTEKKIEATTNAIDSTRSFIEKTNALNSCVKGNGIDAGQEKFISLLEFRLLVGILLLDLTTSIRIYLNAKFQYEGVYSARQIFVIINEGYKKLYNFITKDKSGNDKFILRDNSFWKKEIGDFVVTEISDLTTDYDNITRKLDDYLKNHFENIKDLRDLSIHYGKTSTDKNPIQVYDMIVKFDIDNTFQRMIPFLDILNEMFVFTYLMLIAFNKKLDTYQQNQADKFDNLIFILKNLECENENFNSKEYIEILEDMKLKFL